MTFTFYLFKLNDVVYFISISIYLGCWLYRSFIDRVHPPTPFIQFLFMCFSFEFPPPLYCILLGISTSILWLNLRIFWVWSFFGCLRIFYVLGYIWKASQNLVNFFFGRLLLECFVFRFLCSNNCLTLLKTGGNVQKQTAHFTQVRDWVVDVWHWLIIRIVGHFTYKSNKEHVSYTNSYEWHINKELKHKGNLLKM